MISILAALWLALVLDWIVGEPKALWQRLPHPVVSAGRLIDWLDRTFNREGDAGPARLRAGAIAFAGLVIAAIIAGMLIQGLLAFLGPVSWMGEGVLASVLIAQKSMRDHVNAVVSALREDGLEAGRKAVSQIVGRDPAMLDRPGVTRASIESLAENFSDGVVAPAFWFAIGGLPGLFAYKMINTADSMIGHRSERHEQFGKVSAIADDLANWVPARLSAGLVAVAAAGVAGRSAAANAIATAFGDAGLHRSPNAGWPEAAMAGALDIQLGGARIYQGETVSQAHLNSSGRPVEGAVDISRALQLFDHACFCLWALVAAALMFSLLAA